MAEYIERKAAMDIVRQTYGNYSAAFPKLRKLPAADVAPVRHGDWMEWFPGDCALIMTGEEMLYRCSSCDAKYPDAEGYKYCPNCGAKMDL